MPKSASKPANNMYADSVKQWNVIVGCRFDCIYCRASFQRQMKRQKRNCEKCYAYMPHFHENRLNDPLPETQGDEFIWVASSSDIACADSNWIDRILHRIAYLPDRTFLFQSKDSLVFYRHVFPPNCLLGITLETTSDLQYVGISKAPPPRKRFKDFLELDVENKKIVTIEPILRFDSIIFVHWMKKLQPERVYIGYDTKGCKLKEPKLADTLKLIAALEKVTKVKPKLLREAWNLQRPLEDYC